MRQLTHKIYIFSMVAATVVVFFLLVFYGSDYYSTAIDERHFHMQNDLFKPTGLIGHGIGILGSAFMVIGVFGYMARKRIRFLSRVGVLKYWLEFHIFLCIIGPILVLFHTSFKFGGIVAVSFWSMVAVVISGVVGRFIYLQIPRTIEGREMSLNDLSSLETDLFSRLINQFEIDADILVKMNETLKQYVSKKDENFPVRIVKRFFFEKKLVNNIRRELKMQNPGRKNIRKATRIVKAKIILNRRIAWLSAMQNFLRYWHVVHLPFALVMLVIMLIHIAVAVLFGYKWIF
jgi:hypothetical protein